MDLVEKKSKNKTKARTWPVKSPDLTSWYRSNKVHDQRINSQSLKLDIKKADIPKDHDEAAHRVQVNNVFTEPGFKRDELLEITVKTSPVNAACVPGSQKINDSNITDNDAVVDGVSYKEPELKYMNFTSMKNEETLKELGLYTLNEKSDENMKLDPKYSTFTRIKDAGSSLNESGLYTLSEKSDENTEGSLGDYEKLENLCEGQDAILKEGDAILGIRNGVTQELGQKSTDDGDKGTRNRLNPVDRVEGIGGNIAEQGDTRNDRAGQEMVVCGDDALKNKAPVPLPRRRSLGRDVKLSNQERDSFPPIDGAEDVVRQVKRIKDDPTGVDYDNLALKGFISEVTKKRLGIEDQVTNLTESNGSIYQQYTLKISGKTDKREGKRRALSMSNIASYSGTNTGPGNFMSDPSTRDAALHKSTSDCHGYKWYRVLESAGSPGERISFSESSVDGATELSTPRSKAATLPICSSRSVSQETSLSKSSTYPWTRHRNDVIHSYDETLDIIRGYNSFNPWKTPKPIYFAEMIDQDNYLTSMNNIKYKSDVNKKEIPQTKQEAAIEHDEITSNDVVESASCDRNTRLCGLLDDRLDEMTYSTVKMPNDRQTWSTGSLTREDGLMLFSSDSETHQNRSIKAMPGVTMKTEENRCIQPMPRSRRKLKCFKNTGTGDTEQLNCSNHGQQNPVPMSDTQGGDTKLLAGQCLISKSVTWKEKRADYHDVGLDTSELEVEETDKGSVSVEVRGKEEVMVDVEDDSYDVLTVDCATHCGFREAGDVSGKLSDREVARRDSLDNTKREEIDSKSLDYTKREEIKSKSLDYTKREEIESKSLDYTEFSDIIERIPDVRPPLCKLIRESDISWIGDGEHSKIIESGVSENHSQSSKSSTRSFELHLAALRDSILDEMDTVFGSNNSLCSGCIKRPSPPRFNVSKNVSFSQTITTSEATSSVSSKRHASSPKRTSKGRSNTSKSSNHPKRRSGRRKKPMPYKLGKGFLDVYDSILNSHSKEAASMIPPGRCSSPKLDLSSSLPDIPGSMDVSECTDEIVERNKNFLQTAPQTYMVTPANCGGTSETANPQTSDTSTWGADSSTVVSVGVTGLLRKVRQSLLASDQATNDDHLRSIKSNLLSITSGSRVNEEVLQELFPIRLTCDDQKTLPVTSEIKPEVAADSNNTPVKENQTQPSSNSKGESLPESNTTAGISNGTSATRNNPPEPESGVEYTTSDTLVSQTVRTFKENAPLVNLFLSAKDAASRVNSTSSSKKKTRRKGKRKRRRNPSEKTIDFLNQLRALLHDNLSVGSNPRRDVSSNKERKNKKRVRGKPPISAKTTTTTMSTAKLSRRSSDQSTTRGIKNVTSAEATGGKRELTKLLPLLLDGNLEEHEEPQKQKTTTKPATAECDAEAKTSKEQKTPNPTERRKSGHPIGDGKREDILLSTDVTTDDSLRPVTNKPKPNEPLYSTTDGSVCSSRKTKRSHSKELGLDDGQDHKKTLSMIMSVLSKRARRQVPKRTSLARQTSSANERVTVTPVDGVEVTGFPYRQQFMTNGLRNNLSSARADPRYPMPIRAMQMKPSAQSVSPLWMTPRPSGPLPKHERIAMAASGKQRVSAFPNLFNIRRIARFSPMSSFLSRKAPVMKIA